MSDGDSSVEEGPTDQKTPTDSPDGSGGDADTGDDSSDLPFQARPKSLWRRWDEFETAPSDDQTATDSGEESDTGSADDDTKKGEQEDIAAIGEVEAGSDTPFFELGALPFLTDDPVSQIDQKPDSVDVQFLYGPARTAARNIPLFVAALTVLLLADAELNPEAVGLSTLVPDLPLVPVVYLLALGGGFTVLLLLSDIVDRETLVRTGFVYGLGGFLFAGTVYAAYLTLSTRGGEAITSHAVYGFPTLFFALVLGLLGYDLLLKGETLFSKMGEKNIFHHLEQVEDAETDEDGAADTAEETESGTDDASGEVTLADYNAVKKREITDKIDGGKWGIRWGHMFVALILSQYLVVWSFKGPLGTSMISVLVLNVAVLLVALLSVYNFLIGIVFLRKLIRGELETDDGRVIRPEYRPYHPDQQGGYGDIGKCALHINILLILAGAYYVFRAYISGLRSFPSSTSLDPFYADLLGLQPTAQLELGFWLVNFLGPILLYAALVVFWFYFTFWEMHKQMVRQKKQKILQYQIDFREADSEGSERTIEVPIGEVYDKNQWQELYDAPEWPINTRKIGAIVTGNLVPVALSLPTVVPSLIDTWAAL